MTTDNPFQCTEHGKANAAYICEHLAMNPEQQWYCDYPSEDNPWPDAWCELCDTEFQKEGEWNEKNDNFLKIKMICNHCYELFHAKSIECIKEGVIESWAQMVSECHQQLCTRQELLDGQFGLSKHKRWDYDQQTGLLTFSNNGVPAVISNIEMIGSISTASDTWLWSWANFHILPDVRAQIVAAREFGEKKGFPRLTVPKWQADEIDGWEVSAIAACILDAKGVYRVPTEKGFLFMAMTDIRFAT